MLEIIKVKEDLTNKKAKSRDNQFMCEEDEKKTDDNNKKR